VLVHRAPKIEQLAVYLQVHFICKSRHSICRTVSDDEAADGLVQYASAERAAVQPGASGAPLRGFGA
jgi:hypothetical protein